MEKLVEGNAALVLDVMIGRLRFEQTGVKLYDTVIRKIERSGPSRYHPTLEALRHIKSEEEEHVEWLTEQISSLGADPDEVTDMAELETEESSGIVNVIVDGHDKVIHLLHALLAAELADNAGWDLLVKLADERGDGKAKRAFAKRLAEEVEHLAYIRQAVVSAAEVEILGEDRKLPETVSSALVKPIAIGVGVVAVAVAGGFALRSMLS
ncbi:MAG TPA: hypothetical protein VII38_19995 [Polyangia bacterium]